MSSLTLFYLLYWALIWTANFPVQLAQTYTDGSGGNLDPSTSPSQLREEEDATWPEKARLHPSMETVRWSDTEPHPKVRCWLLFLEQQITPSFLKHLYSSSCCLTCLFHLFSRLRPLLLSQHHHCLQITGRGIPTSPLNENIFLRKGFSLWSNGWCF